VPDVARPHGTTDAAVRGSGLGAAPPARATRTDGSAVRERLPGGRRVAPRRAPNRSAAAVQVASAVPVPPFPTRCGPQSTL